LNPGTELLLNLAGGVALLLWGVRMVRTGIMRAYGDNLKHFIERHLGSPLISYATGAAATLLLQSSTATAMLMAGLAASGLLAAGTGLAVLLGADAGSAVVSALFATGGQFVVFLFPVLLVAGYVTFTTTNEFRPHNAGRIMIGLGLTLLALRIIVTSTTPLREATLFHQVLTTLGSEPLLALIAGALATWVSHSSLPVILLIASFVANGSLEPEAALAYVLGVNFGGGLPALSVTAGMPRDARRLVVANLSLRALGALALIPFVKPISAAVAGVVAYAPAQPLLFHAGFNILLGAIFLPFTEPVTALVRKLLPDPAVAQDHLAEPRYLDPSALSAPALALSNAQHEMTRMAELLERMLNLALDVFRSGAIEPLKELRQLDQRLNSYQHAILSYLADLTLNELSPGESRRTLDVMLFASNLEHAGDIIVLNLADRLKARKKASIEFTPAQCKAIEDLALIVRNAIRLSTSVLASGDVEGAKRLIAEKASFRSLENKVLNAHFRSSGETAREKTLRQSALFVDLIRDLHSINTHVVAAAYPVVEEAGLLRDTRLRMAAAVTATSAGISE
jgi:phosphate:Na+ symporter